MAITRIPQPQFAGPSPSEAVTSAGVLSQRYAEMFMQGVQESARNYMAQKQLDQQKQLAEEQMKSTQSLETQREQSESEKLRLGMLGQDLQNDLLKSGPMSYVDRKTEWLQYYGALSKGDKDLAKAMYEGGAGALNRMSATGLLQAGLIGQAPPQTQATPTAPQATMPQGPVQAPSAMPSAPTPAPAATPSAPSVPPYMSGLSTTPTAPQGLAPGQSASITQVTKGIPQNAVTIAADAGLEKLAGIASGNVDPGTRMTPREQTAINKVVAPTYQVLKNARTQAFVEAGGSEEVLQRAADSLTQAAKNDPQFAQWLQSASMLTKDEASSFNQAVENDTKLQQLAAKMQRDLDLKNTAYLNAAIKATSDRMMFQARYDSLQARIAASKDTSERAQLLSVDKAWQRTDDMIKNFAAQGNAIRSAKAQAGMSEDQINDEIKKEIANPASGLAFSLQLAAKHYATAMGIPESEVPNVEASFEASFLGNIPLPFLKKSEAGSVSVPSFTGQPTAPSPTTAPSARPNAPVAGPAAPRTRVTVPEDKGSDYAKSLGF